ncbi:TRAP transporter small permease [Ramlibacter henchirensis]|uniref:TRAP transporter small permease protein n=1 Tax=Ramlibacter henchirensis TaxID=204072 RepID=A0A4Z0C7M4_9BURK|nr:TRAP transporter small permease [Ramlibacter henchirensis]TFZ07281.1 TRAP transporter small permease [Ramlibacter henchirensis]
MRRALDLLFDAAGAIGALLILSIFLLMLYGSAGRMAGLHVGGVNDVVAWCTAAASFFAMAHAFKHGDFVRVTLLLDRLDARARRLLETVSLAIAGAAVAYLAWWAMRFTYESWQFKEMSGGLVVIPIWIPQLSFVIGSLLFVLAVLDELLIVLRGGKPTYVRLVEERHARGDYSEDV